MAKKKTVRRNGKVLHGAAAMAVLKSRAKKARKSAAKKRTNPATKKRPAKKRSNPRPATKKKVAKKTNPATKKKPAKKPAKRRNGPRRYWYQVTSKRNGVLYGHRVPHRNPSEAPDAIIKMHQDFLGRPISDFDNIEVPYYFPDDVVNAGDVVAIEYLAAKDHLEDGEIIHWRHEFGEEGGQVPIMALSEDGKIFLAGGDYWIAPEGIRD